MGVITPLSEQLTKPLPNALVLVNLKELSTGVYKLLPQGATHSEYFFLKVLNNYMDIPSDLMTLYKACFENYVEFPSLNFNIS